MVLASLRKISGKIKLERIKPKKSVKPVSFSKIESIGFLFYLNDPAHIRYIQKVQKHPFINGKNISILCWLKSSKKQPHPVVEGINFIDRPDFNVNFLPTSKAVKLFCDQPFDLLIDLTLEDHFPIHAIAVLSKANFKAGIFYKKNKHSHLKIMLDRNKKRNSTILFEQTLIYIEQLFS